MEIEEARTILLDHARHPRHRLRALSPEVAAAKRGECRNPLCGDHVRVFVSLGQNRVLDCSTLLQGCTMCLASASMMSEQIRGLTITAARERLAQFEAVLTQPPGEDWPAELAALGAFSHLRVNRARIPCALLPWFALKQALSQNEIPDVR